MSTYQCEYVYCADIGSMQARAGNSFGWAGLSIDPNGQRSSWEYGNNPQELADAVAEGLNRGDKVALGFECPLWIPIRTDPIILTSARCGERMAWSASAGQGSLTIGLAQVSWILQKIREKPTNAEPFLDWNSYRNAEGGLYIWEAFVSGDAKAGSHIGDAKAGVSAFVNALPELETSVTKPPESKTRSLIGAALLWASWSEDLCLLHQTCTVIEAQGPTTQITNSWDND